MKKLKELNLSVGRSPAEYPGTSTSIPLGYNGQFIGNADTSNSRRMQALAASNEEVDLDDEELQEQEDDMLKEILNARIKKENKYSLLETLENISNVEEENLDEESFEEVDLEEFSAVGGGALGAVPVPPVGDSEKGKYKSAKKALEEQREQIARLQAYHQKTSNRLK